MKDVIKLVQQQIGDKGDGPANATSVTCFFGKYSPVNHLWVVQCFFYDENDVLIGRPDDPALYSFDDDTGLVVWPR